jgi:Cys-tRNA(Pro)/Cys-tRNA(Cys) deacylase
VTRRPPAEAGRSPGVGSGGPTPAVALLVAAGVAHRVLRYDHDPTAESFGGEVAEALDLDPGAVLKTLVARVDDAVVVALVPVTGRLDLKALALAVGGRRAVMADAAVAERATGYVVGGISPLGHKRRLPVVIDAGVTSLDEVFVSGGRRGLELGLAPGDLTRMCRASSAPISGG